MPLDNILVTIPQFRSNLVLKGVSVPEMILISNHHISIEYIFFFLQISYAAKEQALSQSLSSWPTPGHSKGNPSPDGF